MSRKKVWFPANKADLAHVIYFKDSKHARDYRKTFWEFVAIDRMRFNERIKKTSAVLTPILSLSHREVISEYLAARVSGAELSLSSTSEQ